MPTNYFQNTTDRIVAVKGGVTIFDTNAKHFNRIPSGEISLTGHTITFPNFYGNTYSYFYKTYGLYTDYCNTLGRIAPQEWSSTASYPFNLPDEDLGVLPVGTDYLEVIVNLTRTTTPPQLFGARDWPMEIIEGKDMPLLGGACLVERMEGLCRMFEIVIDSGHAVLRRKMSVTARSNVTTYDDAGYSGVITHVLDNKIGNGNQVKESQSGHCSFVNSRDYSSVYTGSIIVTPCRRT